MWELVTALVTVAGHYRGNVYVKPYERRQRVYVWIDKWFRHYLASIAYCSGIKRTFYALTFDTDGNDKSRELFNAVIEANISRCGNQESTGYAVDTTEEGRDSGNTYPSIEVGEL